ncbi:MAG: WD40 repeat domain-containing protein, partial [Planktothrix sp.]
LIVTEDGQQVVSAASDNTLKIWDLENGRELHTLRKKKHSQIQLRQAWQGFQEGISQLPQALFNFSTKFIQPIQVRQSQQIGWNFINQISALDRVKIMDIALTPDGKRAISASGDHTLTIWNLA